MLAGSWGPLVVPGSEAGGLRGWAMPGILDKSPEGGKRSPAEPLRPGEPSPAAR